MEKSNSTTTVRIIRDCSVPGLWATRCLMSVIANAYVHKCIPSFTTQLNKAPGVQKKGIHNNTAQIIMHAIGIRIRQDDAEATQYAHMEQ